FRRFSHGFFCGRGLSFLSQDRDGFLVVASRFHKRGTAIRETGVRSLARFLYELCRDLHCWLLCTHPFFSLLIGNFLWCYWLQNGPHRIARRGPHKFPTRAIALS